MQKKPFLDQQGIVPEQERHKMFLRYIISGWLIFGLVTLIAWPFFPQQQNQFVYLLTVIFPTYLLMRLLHRVGKTRLAGIVFTIIVNFWFYGLFLVYVREMGAHEAFRTE